MNTNENLNKKSLSKVITLLIILAIIVLGIGFAYARYVTTRKGTADAQIANWSVVIKLDDKTNENVLIDLANTRKNVPQEAEVQEGYIGPGTAGKFDVVIDARDSDVSLEYKISLDVDNQNNTKFPKNLIFYSDPEMNNAIYHDGDTINLNGFIGWDDDKINKQVTTTLYWKWAYETGKTQEEIDENDIADSYWMGKPPIELSMNVLGKQVTENLTSEYYVVTFDANGGNLEGYGNSSRTTKYIASGDQYGNLPTPTMAGYTFVGWSTDNSVPVVENLLSGVRNFGGNITKIDDSKWYVDYTEEIKDTYITFKTATGNELIQGEYYTLLFNVLGLTESANVAFGFPRDYFNSIKLKNGINKIKFNEWVLRTFNNYDFDDFRKDATQQFYLSDFILYKNYGDDYLETELPNLTPDSNKTFYALWKEN